MRFGSPEEQIDRRDLEMLQAFYAACRALGIKVKPR